MSDIRITGLYRYPLKSCHGEALSEVPVDPLGLAFDRRWMAADPHGRMITGRDEPRLVLLRAAAAADHVQLSAPGMDALRVACAAMQDASLAWIHGTDFSAWAGSAEGDAWLSCFLGRPARLLYIGEQSTRRIKRRPELPVAFADSYPILLTSSDSLAVLDAQVGRPMAMARFRPNIVISGGAAFAEDGWRRIAIGDVVFSVEKPCERCVFTTVDPDSGEKSLDQEPLRSLAKFRKTPAGVLFGMNLIAENAGYLSLDMPLRVLD
ncbi:MOSC domain-containing protein [Uliginosibacterium sediminicola]|uniref:MOSC domain-containing protein n=1 Tax=Uliginosibacterium sediminicola TaxID=2024550 RepID=A0ABU9YU48_9RHOO